MDLQVSDVSFGFHTFDMSLDLSGLSSVLARDGQKERSRFSLGRPFFVIEIGIVLKDSQLYILRFSSVEPINRG